MCGRELQGELAEQQAEAAAQAPGVRTAQVGAAQAALAHRARAAQERLQPLVGAELVLRGKPPLKTRPADHVACWGHALISSAQAVQKFVEIRCVCVCVLGKKMLRSFPRLLSQARTPKPPE